MDFVALAAVVMVFSIPLTAIWTSFKLKSKKLELEGGDSSTVKDLKRQLGNLMDENELLRERLKTVEMILSTLPISNSDKEKLRISIEQNEISLEEVEKWREVDSKNKLF